MFEIALFLLMEAASGAAAVSLAGFGMRAAAGGGAIRTDVTRWGAGKRILFGVPVFLLGVMLVYHAVALPYFNYWGVTDQERTMAYPDDEFVPAPLLTWIHGITIEAPPSEVWKWIVQIGGDRAGWYSHTWAENMFGFGIYNTYELRPEWQTLEKGQKHLGNRYGNTGIIEDVVPGKYLAQRWDTRVDDSDWGTAIYPRTGETIRLRNWYFFPESWEEYDSWLTWVFYIKELPNGHSKLLSRGSMDWTDHNPVANAILALALEMPHNFMDIELLQQVKDCAEGNASNYSNTTLPEGGTR